MVNADDLGADETRNEGIAEAVAAGAVTSVSLLANGPALEHGLARLRALPGRHVSLGAHLNLSEGRPLGRGHRLLVGADGAFLGKAAARDLLHLRGDAALEAEVATEVEAQLERLAALGCALDHLDGHQHVHAFPAVLGAALAAAVRHGIGWVRIPDEPWPPGGDEAVPAARRGEARAFLAAAREARRALADTALRTPDHFRGLFLRDAPGLPAWEAVVGALPEGLTELMVHPGRRSDGRDGSPFARFSTASREEELEALLSPRFRLALERRGVRLVPFPPREPAPCAS